jgi:hypothetical protein
MVFCLIVKVFAFISLGIVLLSTFTFILSTLEEFQVRKDSHIQYTEKKVNDFPVPTQDVTYPTLPGREKFNYSANLFLQCTLYQQRTC